MGGSMKELFKIIIAEFHATKPPIPVKRDLKTHPLKDLRKAQIFIGMRRSGKTWIMYQIMHELLEQGVDLSKILYINFEDDRLSDMVAKNFQDILAAYYELYPNYVGADDIHFFFDEIHEIPVWEKFIRRLLDQEKMQLYITGSSAKMLGAEIASNLRGRTLVYEVFPYNFTEYLRAIEVPIPDFIAGKARMVLQHHLKNFLTVGGFPEVVNKSAEVHRLLLQGYLDTVIYRDVIERHHIVNAHPLRLLLTHCMRNSATVFSINKIYNSFKSLGQEVSKNSLYEYMDYFEDAYCVFSLERFNLSLRKASHGMKKIFAVDQGLITSQTISRAFDEATLLETAVFAHLRRKSHDVFYYNTKDGKEVDFVLAPLGFESSLYQVSVTLKDPSTRQREIDALATAMKEQKIKAGVIVTLEEEEKVILKDGTIKIIPALNFLLERESFITQS